MERHDTLNQIVKVLTSASFEGAYDNLRKETAFRFLEVVDLGSMVGFCYCKHPIRYEFWVTPVDKPLSAVVPDFEADNPAVRGDCLVVGSSCIKAILGLDDKDADEMIKLYREALAIRDEVARLSEECPGWYEKHGFVMAAWPVAEGCLPLPLRRLGVLLIQEKLPFPQVLLEKVQAEYGKQQRQTIIDYMQEYLATGLKSDLFETCLPRLRHGWELSEKQIGAIMSIMGQVPDPGRAAAEIMEQKRRLAKAWQIVGPKDAPFIGSLFKRVNGEALAALPMTAGQLEAFDAMARRYATSALRQSS